MGESAIEGLSLLAMLAGPNPGVPLSWMGNFDDAGFQLTLSGPYRGQSLNLGYSGVFHPAGTLDPVSDAITWNGSGTLASGTFSASGTVVLVDDWDWKSIAIGVVTIVGDAAIVGAEVFAAAPTGGGSAAVSVKAISYVTAAGIAAIAGQDVVKKICKSPCTFEGSSNYVPTIPTGLAVNLPIIVQMSSGEINGGSVGGQATVEAAPETRTTVLFLLGALCMAAYACSRGTNRPAS